MTERPCDLPSADRCAGWKGTSYSGEYLLVARWPADDHDAARRLVEGAQGTRDISADHVFLELSTQGTPFAGSHRR
jgi:hypothetical protein